MPQTLTNNPGAALLSAVAASSREERLARLDRALRAKADAEAQVLAIVGEVERDQDYRDDGATSTEAWLAERFGLSLASARAYVHVAKKVAALPNLVGSLCAGEVSFDKVRVLADVATPRSERRLCQEAKESTVRELASIARAAGERERAMSPAQGHGAHDRRFCRFNDEHRTLSVQLPPDAYALTRARVEASAKEIPSEGETPWDQRCADAFVDLIGSPSPSPIPIPSTATGSGPGSGPATGSGSQAGTALAPPRPYVVVLHAPLGAFVDESGEDSALVGDLERHGLIDAATVRRIACDATLVVALDDDVGHTMYEGRARRFPTPAQRREVMRRDRHCRFPGCTNLTFAQVHHIVEWKAGGRTDLPSLVLLCQHHHGLVHRKVWTMSGNANEDLTFIGPSGRVMTSRPSSKWTRVTDKVSVGGSARA